MAYGTSTQTFRERWDRQAWGIGGRPKGNPPHTVRAEVYARDDHKCVTCGTSQHDLEELRRATPRKERRPNRYHLTLDHIIPRCKGGTNEAHNLQTMCPPCNTAKADSLPDTS